MASEPVFSVGPSVQVPCQVPAIPNGSSTQAKPDERSGKMTAEQLAAIEDEELLDKMVLHTQVIILGDLDSVAPLCCNKQIGFGHSEQSHIHSKSLQLREGIFGEGTAERCTLKYSRATLAFLSGMTSHCFHLCVFLSCHSSMSQKTLRRGR